MFWSSDVLSESKTRNFAVAGVLSFWSSDVLSESKTNSTAETPHSGFGAATF